MPHGRPRKLVHAPQIPSLEVVLFNGGRSPPKLQGITAKTTCVAKRCGRQRCPRQIKGSWMAEKSFQRTPAVACVRIQALPSADATKSAYSATCERSLNSTPNLLLIVSSIFAVDT